MPFTIGNKLGKKFTNQGKTRLLGCEVCGTLVKRFYSSLKDTKYVFCSNECKYRGFNKLFAGRNNPFFGKKHTLDSIRKIKENYVGMTGKAHTEETKKKMSAIAKKNGFGLWWIGRKQTLEHSKNSGLSRQGDRHYRWKNGITPERKKLYFSAEYKFWRKSVFERDNYTCVVCGKQGGELNADHIKPWCEYIDLRFAIDNGRTLCLVCHRKTDTWGVKKKQDCFKPIPDWHDVGKEILEKINNTPLHL